MAPLRFFPLLLVTAFLAGCSDDPSNVGGGIVDGDLVVERIVLSGDALSVQSGIAVVSNSSNQLNDAVLVGTADDGTTAHGLFNLVDRSSRLDDIAAGDIQKVEFRFRTVGYRYGDVVSGETGFDVVSFDGTFGNAAQYSEELVGRLEAGRTLASVQTRLPDSAVYRVELDRQAAADFLRGYYELDTVTDGNGGQTITTTTLLSLGFRANGGGSTISALLGATSSSFADSLKPAIVVTLPDTVITLRLGVSNWIVSYPASLATGPDLPVIAAGAPIRTLLSFPLDSIPSDALIVRAELTLHIAEGSEQTGTTGPIENVVAWVAGPDPLTSPSRLATFPESLGQVFSPGRRPAFDSTRLEDFFRFSQLNGIVTAWLRHRNTSGRSGYANNGLIIALGRSRPDLESATVDRLSFVGPSGPAGLRPMLEVTYARPATSND